GYFINYLRMTRLVREHGIESEGAELNIRHMIERMQQFYPLFRREARPEDWFKTEEEKTAYYRYVCLQDLSAYYRRKVDGIRDRIPEHARLWIYGAGVIGKKAYRALESEGYRIEGFLVSSMAGNPGVLFGREVRAADTVTPGPDDVAVIAMAMGEWEDVGKVLAGRGWNYVPFGNAR
ncbi:MAG: hypothetical protein J6U26_05120, partial [Lachnospiraceae bacterium]|nr:hypothetical protein [Lachnospiraceae bacterium]